ncbi:RsmB/NOP family class I SAM-dependent RNA methyltransferase [Hydromonas duriensis]|uniref:16S rRNA (Cytosine967-C5)-methyltransferase n=1 Tax=Hydromonas duriensis TaxID=1527608 RepID=A0A4V3DJS1_9BURK|nr:RsmB/NOP family class I SAM-dependent RNA methyltransferase [Hydromonas duriensis]TDR31170.1 16S rRNA (cytosine967-C5)-methyltransferase [Hydromonas duriensis]
MNSSDDTKISKKKSYSKKPSKKERLAQELAEKAAQARVAAGGLHIRADGVSVSAAALAARQAALNAARGEISDATTKKPRSTRAQAGLSPTVVRIEASSPQGDRLAQCLWSAQVLLLDILKFDMAADKLVSRHLREHRELGARDRHIVAETIYTVLRQKRVLSHLAQSGGGTLERRLVLLAARSCTTETALQAAIAEDEWTWLSQVSSVDISALPVAVRSNMSDEWLAQLTAAYGEAALPLAEALNTSAPLDIRVNTIKSSREAVQVALQHAELESTPCALAPLGLRLNGKPALQKTDIFTSGAIEVQDEGSQLLTHLLGAKRGEMVADFCAGAGGKTLAIGAMMRNSGRLYAFDTAAHRLAKLKPRLARSGLSNVQAVAIDSETDVRVKRLYGKLDRVFIDAPCSGLGTLRRNPDLKWRHGVDSVARLSNIQTNILNSAAKLVKIGGTVVYATCSVLPTENQDVVKAFLAAHPNYALVDVNEALAVQNISLPEGAVTDGMLQLLPHLHHTDGFFAACLKRIA